ncbi:MAG TPA: cytochrome c biogenesis protein CcsA [Burkholderiaceae bacterium]
MILSFDSPAAAALSLSGAVAVGAYTLAAWRGEPRGARWQPVLVLAWLAQALALTLDISGLTAQWRGARFGFAPALSLTIWLVVAVYLIESRMLPLPGARRVLCLLAALGCALALAFPGESRPAEVSPWAPLHWILGLASYGLFGAAVLHAAMWSRAERALRSKLNPESGMPLMQLERLTFQFVAAGVAVLSLAIAFGWWFTPHWRWDHKTLLSILGWLVLSGLLFGRLALGWRGRRATRWLYVGASLLLLSYAGSRFVLEIILHRTPS